MNDELVKRGEGRGPLRGSRIGAATGGRNGDWGGTEPRFPDERRFRAIGRHRPRAAWRGLCRTPRRHARLSPGIRRRPPWLSSRLPPGISGISRAGRCRRLGPSGLVSLGSGRRDCRRRGDRRPRRRGGRSLGRPAAGAGSLLVLHRSEPAAAASGTPARKGGKYLTIRPAVRKAGSSASSESVGSTPPAGVEQAQHEPDRHYHHRAGQENAADLLYVREPVFDDVPQRPLDLVEQADRIEAEGFENETRQRTK